MNCHVVHALAHMFQIVTVFIVDNCRSGNYCSYCMYTVFVWKAVQLEHGVVYYFHYEPVWILVKRQCVDYGPYSFFHGLGVPFYFSYIFISTGDFQHNFPFFDIFPSCMICLDDLF